MVQQASFNTVVCNYAQTNLTISSALVIHVMAITGSKYYVQNNVNKAITGNLKVRGHVMLHKVK